MILRTFTLSLASSQPAPGLATGLHDFFATRFNEYAALHRGEAGTFIHRYPVVQFRMIGNVPTATGINEGADCLRQLAAECNGIRVGENSYTIAGPVVPPKEEEFGISDTIRSYEFVTPWLALNQEDARKFYTLKGKPERDAFIRKILTENILSMARSLNYPVPGPIACTVNIHFQKERINGAGVLVFTGKFQANFLIPDLLGIGKSVSRGFGAVRHVKDRKIFGNRD